MILVRLLFAAQLAGVVAVPHTASLLEEKICVGPRCSQPVSKLVEGALALTSSQPVLACAKVFQLVLTQKEPGPPSGSYSMSPRMELLNAGIGEAAAQGLLRSLEAETGHSLVPSGMLCWMAISAMGVQYDHERSVALYEHAPHLWDALVAWNKRVRSNSLLLQQSVVLFAGLYGVPPSDQALRDMDKAGGIDLMFDVLERNTSDLLVLQAAWAGLSDNVENSRVGAELVADKGGKGKGLEFLLGLLSQYHGKHAAPGNSPFGLRYECVHDINGILMHDDKKGSWQAIAANGGFMEEATLAMREEPDNLLTQENGCEAIALMGRGSTANLAHLEELGTIKLMVDAIWRFRTQADGNYYQLNSCSSGLVLFARKGAEYQESMLQLGLLEGLEASIPLWVGLQPRKEPWGSRFPWIDVLELRNTLTRRSKR